MSDLGLSAEDMALGDYWVNAGTKIKNAEVGAGVDSGTDTTGDAAALFTGEPQNVDEEVGTTEAAPSTEADQPESEATAEVAPPPASPTRPAMLEMFSQRVNGLDSRDILAALSAAYLARRVNHDRSESRGLVKDGAAVFVERMAIRRARLSLLEMKKDYENTNNSPELRLQKIDMSAAHLGEWAQRLEHYVQAFNNTDARSLYKDNYLIYAQRISSKIFGFSLEPGDDVHAKVEVKMAELAATRAELIAQHPKLEAYAATNVYMNDLLNIFGANDGNQGLMNKAELAILIAGRVTEAMSMLHIRMRAKGVDGVRLNRMIQHKGGVEEITALGDALETGKKLFEPLGPAFNALARTSGGMAIGRATSATVDGIMEFFAGGKRGRRVNLRQPTGSAGLTPQPLPQAA